MRLKPIFTEPTILFSEKIIFSLKFLRSEIMLKFKKQKKILWHRINVIDK